MGEYVLITGASSGIGKALAYEFALHGNNLILVARRGDTSVKYGSYLVQKRAYRGTDPSKRRHPESGTFLWYSKDIQSN